MREYIMLIVGIIALITYIPTTKLIERYLDRIQEEDWLRKKEEAKTKPVFVGQLRELLKR